MGFCNGGMLYLPPTATRIGRPLTEQSGPEFVTADGGRVGSWMQGDPEVRLRRDETMRCLAYATKPSKPGIRSERRESATVVSQWDIQLGDWTQKQS
jgi:hypothetical protein